VPLSQPIDNPTPHAIIGNLAFLVNRQVCFDNERSHIELLLGYRDNGHGSVEGGGWRLILVYYGKVLLHGHYKDKRDEVLMGLLEASAKEVTDILRPQG
jgi:hypothetical protein